jgi:acetyl-CoA carboxylase biotin carboxylase subunit
VHTTIPFHLKLMDHEKFKEGNFNTKFLEKYDVMNSKIIGGSEHE